MGGAYLGGIAAGTLLLAIAAGAADIPVATAVQFNTACTRCHEGECSGRMTFDLAPQAAANHLARYVGDVPSEVQRDLLSLLAYMKQACAYHPLAVQPPPDGLWTPETLASLRSPAGDAYFIPLGVLAAGRHRAELTFDAAGEACVQVISPGFEIEDRPALKIEAGGIAFVFAVERPGAHYLRLETVQATRLTGLRIAPLP